jgi:hypothetical protein
MSLFFQRLDRRVSRRLLLHPLAGAVIASTMLFAATAEGRDDCPGDAFPEEYRWYVQLEIGWSCPCDEPADRAAYRRCAADLAEVLTSPSLQVIRPECQKKLTRELRRSTCGRPESVVCCVTKANGAHLHRVARSAEFCESTPVESRCISPFQSVAGGCDSNGCTAPDCGNGVVETGETCEPPGFQLCDYSCQIIPCEIVPPSCGNLILDDGETCEPPGLGACGHDCRDAACAPPRAGETAVTCVEGYAAYRGGVDVAASSAGYLVVWEGPHRRDHEILAHGLNADGVAAEGAVIEVSAAEPCATYRRRPTVGFDGSAWYVAWDVGGDVSWAYRGDTVFQAVHGRRLDLSGGNSPIHEFARLEYSTETAQCFYSRGASNVSRSSRTAMAWVEHWECATVGIWIGNHSLHGVELTFDGEETVVTPTLYGGESELPASLYATRVGDAGLDSSAEGTLWAWNGNLFDEWPGIGFQRAFIAARWSDGPLLSPIFELTTREVIAGDSEHFPAVASGPTAFLVAWAQGEADFVTLQTEIRAVRVSKTEGRLDADGGFLVATVPGGVVGAPDAVFDGERWFVAWVEATTSGNELRAVAVGTDGQVVDLIPRLLAEDVTAASPSLASMGDGRALVAFTRPEGGSMAVRTILVDP